MVWIAPRIHIRDNKPINIQVWGFDDLKTRIAYSTVRRLIDEGIFRDLDIEGELHNPKIEKPGVAIDEEYPVILLENQIWCKGGVDEGALVAAILKIKRIKENITRKKINYYKRMLKEIDFVKLHVESWFENPMNIPSQTMIIPKSRVRIDYLGNIRYDRRRGLESYPVEVEGSLKRQGHVILDLTKMEEEKNVFNFKELSLSGRTESDDIEVKKIVRTIRGE